MMVHFIFIELLILYILYKLYPIKPFTSNFNHLFRKKKAGYSTNDEYCFSTFVTEKTKKAKYHWLRHLPWILAKIIANRT